MNRKMVSLGNINQNMKKIDYAVLGPIMIRAEAIKKELEQGVKKPFDEIIYANLGDCHRMGQKPITFIRQVLTLCTYPSLLEDERFPPDVKQRVSTILESCGGQSVGAYSYSTGIEIIQKHVAQYIERRDGFPANYLDIILTSGATEAAKHVLNLLNYTDSKKLPGVLVPIPQYPVYSATIAEYGMHQISYYLDEDNEWALNIKELKRAIADSREISEPRALVVINPGNPTGSVLTRENIEDIIKFAYEERLVLIADEVYQDNIYAEGMQFHSFKKVLMEMGDPYKNMELASFMSTSKGYIGECGFRGGYCELINFDPEVKKVFIKSICVHLCPNVLGQVTVNCVVNPPQKGEPSYDQFIKEKMGVLESLKERALLVAETFNNMEKIKCNRVAGAMYAFPQIILPQKAIQKAESLDQAPDFFYAMQLLEHTGICVVPGSGFGQIPGTYHIRTTILLQTDKLKVMMRKMEEFHKKFLAEFK